jgi:hypothetical protein
MPGARPLVPLTLIALVLAIVHIRAGQSEKPSTAQLLWQFEAGG